MPQSAFRRQSPWSGFSLYSSAANLQRCNVNFILHVVVYVQRFFFYFSCSAGSPHREKVSVIFSAGAASGAPPAAGASVPLGGRFFGCGAAGCAHANRAEPIMNTEQQGSNFLVFISTIPFLYFLLYSNFLAADIT
jgi:hypothetical protein